MGRKDLVAELDASAGVPTIRIKGTINEYTGSTIAVPLARVTGDVAFNLRELAGINSSGVAALSSLLGGFKGKIRYIQAPLAFVSTLNMVPSLLINATVASAMAPFSCSACNAEFEAEINCDEAKTAREECRRVVCPKCGGRGALDLEFEDFFAFLG